MYAALNLIYDHDGPFVLHHGGAAGADQFAAEWAYDRGVAAVPHLPDERLPSPQRFHARNDEMLKELTGPFDTLVAFWDGESSGTESVVRKAAGRGIRTVLVLA